MKGKVIAIEGACDGIGKTTQFQKIIEYFKKNKINFIHHHFPSYNTEHGNLAEKYLNGEYGKKEELSPYLINTIYAFDRAITWNIDLKKAYEQGSIVLLDRYTTSSLIYQSSLIDNIEEKKAFIDWVMDYEYNKLGIVKPDKVIFLYASFDLIMKLKNNRKGNDGIQNDIHEKDLLFMKKVYDNALFVADYLNWNKVKCDDKDKMRLIDDIHKEICEIINKISE